MDTVISLDNIESILQTENPIIKSRVYGSNNINRYKLINPISVKLTTGQIIHIHSGFEWDLASSPRILWAIIVPDSDAEIAFLIHDYLYKYNVLPRKQCDDEMLTWSNVTNGTIKWSLRKIDNYLRYYAVRLFGKSAYKK